MKPKNQLADSLIGLKRKLTSNGAGNINGSNNSNYNYSSYNSNSKESNSEIYHTQFEVFSSFFNSISFF